jgi:hypothetical protein
VKNPGQFQTEINSDSSVQRHFQYEKGIDREILGTLPAIKRRPATGANISTVAAIRKPLLSETHLL